MESGQVKVQVQVQVQGGQLLIHVEDHQLQGNQVQVKGNQLLLGDHQLETGNNKYKCKWKCMEVNYSSM